MITHKENTDVLKFTMLIYNYDKEIMVKNHYNIPLFDKNKIFQ